MESASSDTKPDFIKDFGSVISKGMESLLGNEAHGKLNKFKDMFQNPDKLNQLMEGIMSLKEASGSVDSLEAFKDKTGQLMAGAQKFKDTLSNLLGSDDDSSPSSSPDKTEETYEERCRQVFKDVMSRVGLPADTIMERHPVLDLAFKFCNTEEKFQAMKTVADMIQDKDSINNPEVWAAITAGPLNPLAEHACWSDYLQYGSSLNLHQGKTDEKEKKSLADRAKEVVMEFAKRMKIPSDSESFKFVTEMIAKFCTTEELLQQFKDKMESYHTGGNFNWCSIFSTANDKQEKGEKEDILSSLLSKFNLEDKLDELKKVVGETLEEVQPKLQAFADIFKSKQGEKKDGKKDDRETEEILQLHQSLGFPSLGDAELDRSLVRLCLGRGTPEDVQKLTQSEHIPVELQPSILDLLQKNCQTGQSLAQAQAKDSTKPLTKQDQPLTKRDLEELISRLEINITIKPRLV